MQVVGYWLVVSLFLFRQGYGQEVNDEWLHRQLDAQMRLTMLQPGKLERTTSVWQEGDFEISVLEYSPQDSLDQVLISWHSLFSPWLKQSILNPDLGEWFTTQWHGDTLIGMRKPGYEGKTRLRHQQIVLDVSHTQLSRIEIHIDRDNWLYSESVRLIIQFDKKGCYQNHFLQLITVVPLSGTYVNWVELGRLKRNG